MSRRRSLPRLLVEYATARARLALLEALERREHTWADVTEYGDRHRRYQCTRCPATKAVEHTPREDQP